jgi:hypothetical protein
MKHIVLALAFAFVVPSVAHADDSCEAKAAEKKLAGAAKGSFIKKCQKDAAAEKGKAAEASCQNQAFMKKLNGAAKASFVKKCVKDAQ